MEFEAADAQENVQQVVSSAQTVIEIPMLFDKILDFAMYEGGKVQMKTAKSFKLVSKLWLEKVSDSLYRSRPSEYHFGLFDNNIAQIVSFVDTFKTLPLNRIPPYTLHPIYLDDLLFNSEYLFNCLNCLFWVGQGLRKLHLDLYCGSRICQERPMVFQNVPVPHLYLPQLEDLEIKMGCEDEEDGNVCVKTHGSVRTFLQSIFAGSEAIRRFLLYDVNQSFNSFDFLPAIPKSITEVEIECNFSRGIFTSLLLGNNSLPYLTSLALRFPFSRVDTSNELASVLNHYRQQLKNLEILENDGIDEPQTTMEMPVMESLQKFYLSAVNYEWPDTLNLDFQPCFPELKEIDFHYQTITNVCNWLRRLRCPLVDQVTVYDTFEHTYHTNRNINNEELLTEQSHLLKTAFPNMSKLLLETDYTPQMPHLKVIFQESHQLQHLSVHVTNPPSDLSHHVFNALFIGIRPEDVEALEKQRNDSNRRNLECRSFPSLVQMTELVSFTMFTYGDNHHSKLIFDVAFEYAFLRMPKLCKLKLFGRFEMKQRWQEHCLTLQAKEKDN